MSIEVKATETEKDAYIAANEAFREAQQTRISLNEAVDYAELVEMKVTMATNASSVLISAARGFLATLDAALNEAVEAEQVAGEKAAKEYNALQATKVNISGDMAGLAGLAASFDLDIEDLMEAATFEIMKRITQARETKPHHVQRFSDEH